MIFDLTEIAKELTKFLDDNETATVNENNEIVLPGCPANAYLTFRRSNASGHIYADIFYAHYDEGNRAAATDTWRLDGLPLTPTPKELAKAIYYRALSSHPDC